MLRIDPFSLQLLVAVAREGAISRAAAKVHIAPSALSRRLADLEHALGAPLLVRSALGVELTEAGHRVVARAHELEQLLAALAQDVQALQGVVSGRVRLFANASAVIGFLPERLRRFAADFPQVTVELEERLSSEVVRACLDDLADLGVAAVDTTSSGLETATFARDPLRVVLPKGHPLATAPTLSFQEVLGQPLVCVQHGGALDRLLRERAAAAHATLQVAVTVNSFDAVCRMVEAGLGIAVVPQSAAKAYAGSGLFELRPLTEPWAERELTLMALRKTPRRAAVQALYDALRAGPSHLA
jgi:DNA-binding transcriptional LysR family regulator